MNKIYAVVGMSGSGKSVITDYLENIGYKKIYFGGITYRLMEEAGIERDDDGKNEKEFREKLRKEYGKEFYAKFIEKDILKYKDEYNIVLDGLYSWYEYLYLIEKFPNLKLICVVVDKKIRYDRVGNREDRAFTLDAIKSRDIAEIENLYKGGPIAYSDYYLLNNGSKEELIDRLKMIIEEDV